MNKFFKKVNHRIMSKKSRVLETDAAPSRPRFEEEISEHSSSTEDEDEFISSSNNTKHNKPNLDDGGIPDFEKSETNTSSMGGQSFTQTNNIHINNSSGIHIGNQYHFNVPKTSNPKANITEEDIPSAPSKPQTPPPKVEKTFCNRESAETADFIAIKFEIGPNWRRVAEKLDLSNGDIQQVHEKYHERGTSEVFYQLMLKWKQTQPRTTTTIGLLCEALWNSNETSAASILAKLHPSK